MYVTYCFRWVAWEVVIRVKGFGCIVKENQFGKTRKDCKLKKLLLSKIVILLIKICKLICKFSYIYIIFKNKPIKKLMKI